MRMHSTATEQGIVSGVLVRHVDANAATGIIGRQGLGKVRHLNWGILWIQVAVRETICPKDFTDGQPYGGHSDKQCSTKT